MKKMVSIVLLICCVLLGCDAGHSHRSAGAQGLDDLLKIVSVAVPHQSYMDLRLDSITVLETDPYGRRLLSIIYNLICRNADRVVFFLQIGLIHNMFTNHRIL
jgi:hypothetical protein